MRMRIVKQSSSPTLYKPIGDDSELNPNVPLNDNLKIACQKLKEYTADAELSCWGKKINGENSFYIKHGKDHKTTDYGVVISR